MGFNPKRMFVGLASLAVIIPTLAACGQTKPLIQTVVVQAPTTPPQIVTQVVTQVVKETAAPVGTPSSAAEPYTTKHPVLGDLRVRQAIAYCTNRPELIKSVYPFLSAEDQAKLVMDTFIPPGHWALATENITKYPFDVEKGKALLDEAGWKLKNADDTVRTNADGESLSLSFTTTNAEFRKTWSAVFIKQMADNCGMQLIPTYAPGSWWFGSTTGLRRREFEMGAYAWVGQPDPGGNTLYACNQIPLGSNGWQGQNYMGWCNDTASKAIIAANNTLDRAERIKQYAIAQTEFTKDMVSLPLFNRSEGTGANKNLVNFKPDPTDYYTHNIAEWELKGGGDTVVLAFTQEPASMWSLIESSAVQRTANYLVSITDRANTQLSYDYQPISLKQLPNLANGGAKNDTIEVKAGDKVWNSAGEAVELKPGVELVDADGKPTKYVTGTVKMKQLKVTFEYLDGIKWQDGQPLKKADFELGLKIDCDKDSGATTFQVCDSRAGVEFVSDTSYVVTYLPGVQWPDYSIYTLTAYPAHQVIADGTYKGKTLADVPVKDWSALKEIVETPLSNGPYSLKEWVKGQKMVFEANPNYFKGTPKIKNVIIQIVADTNQAVAQLLTGDVDVVGTETLGAGAEVQTVLDAAKAGKVQGYIIPNPTWEHIDFNLFTK